MNCGKCEHFRGHGRWFGRCAVFSLDGYIRADLPRTHARCRCVLSDFRRREGQHPQRQPFGYLELQNATRRLQDQLVRRKARQAIPTPDVAADARAVAETTSGTPDGSVHAGAESAGMAATDQGLMGPTFDQTGHAPL